MAQQLGSQIELSAALDVLGTVHFAQGRLREHLQVALRRLEITRDPQFGDLREKLDSLRGAGSALMYTGEYAEAIPHLEEAERMAGRMQAIDQQFNALALQVQCWFRLDRWEDALDAEERVRDLGRKYARERTGPMCFPLGLSATIYALRGDEERARTDGTESYDIMVAMTGLLPEGWPLRNQHY
jgi:tetratricopeptide (TPR) repeat protein